MTTHTHTHTFFSIYATSGTLQWQGYAENHEAALHAHLHDLGYDHTEIDSSRVYDISQADYVISLLDSDTDTVYVSVNLNLNLC